MADEVQSRERYGEAFCPKSAHKPPLKSGDLPSRRRDCESRVRLGISERRACRVLGQPRSTQRRTLLTNVQVDAAFDDNQFSPAHKMPTIHASLGSIPRTPVRQRDGVS